MKDNEEQKDRCTYYTHYHFVIKEKPLVNKSKEGNAFIRKQNMNSLMEKEKMDVTSTGMHYLDGRMVSTRITLKLEELDEEGWKRRRCATIRGDAIG
uniref:Uncharacterized protein n=1 Tax=Caenorhabditis japonica TaxID=281687 RepID=A0A8R1EMU5_CAEJA